MVFWLGIITILVFLALILTKRLHVITALVLVPIAAGVVGGYGPELGKMMLGGLKTVSITGIMILFSVMFFGCLLDTGLFNPLIFKIIRTVKSDPLKIAMGTVLITYLIGLDGDGTTTFMIVTLSLLPIYHKVGMNPLVLTCLTSIALFIPNVSPWGGPTTRTMAVLQLSVEDLFIPMLPAYGVGAVWILVIAYILGAKERKRLGYVKPENDSVNHPADMSALLENQDPALLRPGLIWVNFTLFAVAMIALVKGWLPAAVLFIIAFVLVIVINYRDFGVMQGRIMAHAGNALWATTMIFAAGIFTGIFKDTKMLDSLAKALVALIPDAFGSHMGVVASVFGSLLPVVLGPDALYFGIMPVVSQAAAAFGFTPVEIGRAFLTGQWTYAVSPMIGATLLLCSLAKVDFVEHQKFAFIWAFSTCMVIMLASLLLGLFRV